MSRLPTAPAPTLALVAALAACAPGAAVLDPASDPPGAASAGSPVLPLVSAAVGGGCDAALETPPNNACDGEPVLGLDLLSVHDEGGDGAWDEGEELSVDLSLFTTLDDDGTDPWVNYPGVFAHLPPGVRLEGAHVQGEVAWFYAVSPSQPVPLTVRLVADADVPAGTELVFTVGSLNCVSNPTWGPCPTPSPLRLTLGR